MTLTSKFNKGDKIWFPYNGKFYEGSIEALDSWENDRGFLYRISHVASGEVLNEHAYETEIYPKADKESIINTVFVYESEYRLD